MSKIHHSLKIELAIDAAIYKLRKALLGESPQMPNELVVATPTLLISPSSSTTFSSRKSPSSLSDQNSNDDYEHEDDDEEEEEGEGEVEEGEEEEEDDDSDYNDVPIPPTPLWQMDHYANNIPIFIKNQEKQQKQKQGSKLVPKRPSLLPHDISRRGSNVSIRDISPSTSMTRFERRKQITSAQFFIAPEYDWVPEGSKSSPISNNRNLSIVIPSNNKEQ